VAAVADQVMTRGSQRAVQVGSIAGYDRVPHDEPAAGPNPRAALVTAYRTVADYGRCVWT
jgi:hypothetical protein